MRKILRFNLGPIVAAMLACQAITLFAQEFRIESLVFVGKEKEPICESLTLFKGGVVYDFALPEFDEVTVFDQAHARFVLLDHERKVKSILTTVQLLNFVEQLRTEPGFSEQSYLLEPNFKEQLDKESGWLTLASPQITYRAKLLLPEDPDAARAYRKFADGYARLNAAYKGNFHTLARLDLNRSLAEKGQVPQEVELTVTPKSLLGKRLEVRSRHLYNWKLAETDHKRIEKAGVAMADYAEIDLAEFKKSAKLATAKKK